MNIIETKKNNIYFFLNKTQKIKNIHIRINFISEVEKDKTTIYSLLNRVLSNATLKNNTKRKLAKVKRDNYCMNYFTSINHYYKTRVISYSINCINGKYINNSKILDKAIDFINEAIKNPILKDRNKTERLLNIEKKKLNDSISSFVNNKNFYAYKNALKNMYNDEYSILSPLGEKEDLDSVSVDDLINCYDHFQNNSYCSVYITGSVDEDIINNFTYLKSLEQKDYQLSLETNSNLEKDKVVFEKLDVNQAKVVIGYSTNFDITNEYEILFDIFSQMLGENPQSTLFQVVREENSLCYSIDSHILENCKGLIITAGIDISDYEKCVNLIKDIISDYKLGKIDSNLLEISKMIYISELEKIEDNPIAYSTTCFERKLYKTECDIEKIKEKVLNITVDDIKFISNSLTLNIVYALTNGEENV